MILHGDCLEQMRAMEDNSVDSVVTDPPYGISFMGKKWDYDVPKVEVWEEVMRVLKPGGHILVACGTRTQHRMAVNIEDAGFEIRDIVAWVYGSGFPKSYNIGKNLDKYLKTGNASWNGTGDSSRGALGYAKLQHKQGYRPNDYSNKHQNKSEITEDEAKKYKGWGTALKPAMELWTLARKPLSEKTIAETVLKWGTGGINIDESRVKTDTPRPNIKADRGRITGNSWQGGLDGSLCGSKSDGTTTQGRFPANLIHDGSDEVVREFPDTKSGNLNSGHKRGDGTGNSFMGGGGTIKGNYGGDSGSASRFFYCAKASKSERNAGLDGFEEKGKVFNGQSDKPSKDVKDVEARFNTQPTANNHPTVKPIKLMQYLVRLITPKGGIVLDPYMGSGTTGIACKKEGFEFIGIELDKDYFEIAKARIEKLEHQHELF